MGDSENETDMRSAVNRAVKRRIVGELQEMLHENNELVRLFKTAMEIMTTDKHKIIIRADKRPNGSPERQYNAMKLLLSWLVKMLNQELL